MKSLFALLLCSIVQTATGTLELSPSRRPTESLLLSLTCKADLNIETTPVSFFKGSDAQGYCLASVPCTPPATQGYTLTRSGTEAVLTISSVNSSRDSGEWYCEIVVSQSDIRNSNRSDLSNIASVFNWNDIQTNQEWNGRTSVTPAQNIILTMTTPCVKPAPNFTWKYRVDPSGSITDLSRSYSSTSESASGCPSDQKKYTNTLNLPGNTVNFYNKKITLRVAVEHDSFNPNENYIKYRDSRSIQFPVPVSSANINLSNTVNLYEGDTVELTCTTSASFPAATVRWFKGGTEITQNRSSQSGSGVVVTVVVTTTSTVNVPVSRTDQGQKIYCQATNSATGSLIKSNEVQLNVFYPPSKPVITVPNEVCAGREISLTCISLDRGNPQANYQWNTGVTPGGSRWTFTPTKDDNGASITCSAGNAYTERPGYTRIQSNTTTLKVYYTPVLTVTGDPTSREGQDLRLTCSSDPQDAVVTWTYPGGTGQGSTLTIRNLSRHDSRDYTCQGGFGQVCTSLQASKVVQVVVNYAPDITDFKPVTIDEGQTLTLSCQADGRPSQYTFKSFVQYWDGQRVDSQTGDQNGGEYTWSTSAATYLDRGEYECNVNNSIPDRSGKVDQKERVQVLVRGKPVATSDSSPFASGEIGSPVHLFQTFYTSDLNITSYNWTHENSQVDGTNSTSPRKVTLEKNGVKSKFDGFNVNITIPNFLQEGIYTITVCNRLGCTSSTVNITGAGPPHTPTSFSIVNATDTSITVKWKPGSSGGANFVQTFMVEYRVINDGDWKPVTFEDRREADGFVYAEVKGLKPETQYQFRVKSTSNRESGNQSNFTQIASKLTTKVPSPPTNTALIAGAVGGGIGAFIIVALVVAGVMFFRRRRSGGKGKQVSNGEAKYDDDGMIDNDVYVSAGPKDKEVMVMEDNVAYESFQGAGAAAGAVGGAAAVASHYEDTGPLYSEVNKPKKGGKATPKKDKKDEKIDENALYATPMKKDKKGKGKAKKEDETALYATPMKDKKKGKDKGKDKGKAKPKPRGDIYENSEDFVGGATGGDNVYANSGYVGDGDSTEQASAKDGPKVGRDEDGLMYVGVDFGRKKPTTKIHGIEENTEYAEIAIGVKGPPPPEHKDLDDNGEHQV